MKLNRLKITGAASGCLRSDSDAVYEQTLPGHLGTSEKRQQKPEAKKDTLCS